VAFPGIEYDQVVSLPVGIRDSLLLKLRQSIFGNILSSTSVCPSCDEKVEWEMQIESFGLSQPEESVNIKNFKFRKGDYSIAFRLPNSGDILHLSSDQTVETSYRWLLSRCILDIKHKRKELRYEDLPSDILDALAEQMTRKDKFADIRISLSCNKCSFQWEAVFDIISYFWTETNSWARQLLLEIGILASNFGWSEKQIIQLSPVRRKIYLEMVKT
jgi:hypothetical protein